LRTKASERRLNKFLRRRTIKRVRYLKSGDIELRFTDDEVIIFSVDEDEWTPVIAVNKYGVV